MVRALRARWFVLVVAFVAAGGAGCARPTDIADLVSNPERYDGQQVRVRGTVTNTLSIPIVNIRTYTVRDETGEVVVLTSGALPARGERTTVKGTFTTLGTVNGQSLGPHIRVEAGE